MFDYSVINHPIMDGMNHPKLDDYWFSIENKKLKSSKFGWSAIIIHFGLKSSILETGLYLHRS